MKRTSLLTVLLLVACGGGPDIKLPEPEGQAEATHAFPAVVRVVGGKFCTGTLVSPHAVLTASHCVNETGPYLVVSAFGRLSANKVYRLGSGGADDPHDLALLVLGSPFDSAQMTEFPRIGKSVFKGDKVTLVGFGCGNINSLVGIGIKRAGTNVIADISDFLELHTPLNYDKRPFWIHGPANRAGTCLGDSGGPGFLVEGGATRLVGITHSNSRQRSLVVSDLINLTHPANLDFLRRTNQEHTLGIAGL